MESPEFRMMHWMYKHSIKKGWFWESGRGSGEANGGAAYCWSYVSAGLGVDAQTWVEEDEAEKEAEAEVEEEEEEVEVFSFKYLFASIFCRFCAFSSSVRMYSLRIPISKHLLSRQRLQNRRLDTSILHRSSYGHLKYSWIETR